MVMYDHNPRIIFYIMEISLCVRSCEVMYEFRYDCIERPVLPGQLESETVKFGIT